MKIDDTDSDTTSADGDTAATTTRKRRAPKRHLPVVPSSDPRLAGPPPAAPVYPTRFELVLPIAKIRPSPTNPRKRFDELEDLAASIRQHGLQMPPQVRELPGDDGTDFEIIFGERRWRAAKLAGLTTIPAFVVTGIPDDIVIERQIIENVQRKDVDPLDEAFGFRQLLSAGRDVDYIAAKTGKSRSWIYSRLKLAELSEPIRDHIASGQLSPSVALLIARIPDPKLQLQATREVLRVDPFELERQEEKAGEDLALDEEHMQRLQQLNDESPRVGGDEQPEETVPMTVREATEHIQRHYMTRLEHAPFPLDDESLPGGACTKCIHRTGNQVELFADVKRPDVCTNPPCFAGKKRATFEREAEAAAERGAKVLSEAESKKVFHPYHPTMVTPSSGYVELDDKVPAELLPANHRGEAPTWKKLLGQRADVVPAAVAQDAAGGAHELVDRTAALKVLREDGKLPKPPKADRPSRPAHNISPEKREAQEKIADRAIDLAMTEVPAKLAKMKPPALWQFIARNLIELVALGDGGEVMARMAGEPDNWYGKQKEISAKLIADATKGGTDGLAALVVRLLIADRAAVYGGDIGAEGRAVLTSLGLDWKKLREAAAAATKAEAGAAIKWNGHIGKGPKGAVYRITRAGDGWQWKTKNAGALPFDTIDEAKASAEGHAGGGKGQTPAAAAKTKKTAKAAPKAKPSKKSAKKAGRK